MISLWLPVVPGVFNQVCDAWAGLPASSLRTSVGVPHPGVGNEGSIGSGRHVLLCRARGVDAATARRVLVYSFGAEVTMGFGDQGLRDRVQAAVDATLARVPVLDAQPA